MDFFNDPATTEWCLETMLYHKKKALIGLLIMLLALQNACTPKEESAQRYLEEGKVLLEQGKTEQARVQFQNAVQRNPKLADAYYNIALLDEKKQDWKGLFNNLIEAVSIDDNHVEAHFKLGLAYLAAHQLDKAADEASALERLKPGGSNTLALRGDVLFAQGKKAEGIESVRQGMEVEPSNYDIAVMLSSLYLADGNHAKALATLNRAIGLHPQDTGLRLLKIQVQVNSKDYDSAIANYNVLIEENPDKKVFSYGLVQLLINIGRTEQAEAVLREIINKYPNDTDAKLALVGFIGHRDESEAEKTLTKFTAENPDDIPLLSHLAGFYAGRQRYADAQAALNRIINIDKNGAGGLSAKVELAKVALLQKDSKKAQSLIDEVIAADANNPDALVLRAAMRMEKNEVDAAIADLRIVLADNPKQDKVLVLLAKAYQRNGNTDIAESTLRQALEINPGNLDAALPVASKMILKRELDRAEEILNAALKPNPSDPTALQLLAQVRALKKDWGGAQALASQLGRQPKGSPSGHYLSGEIYASQGNFNEAIKQYQSALQEQPEFPEAIRGLAQVYNAQGDRAQLKSYLRAFIEKNPNVFEARIVLAYAHASDKEWNEATKVLQNALRADPKVPLIYQALAGIYQAQDKPDEEIEVFRKGLTELPDDARLMVGLAQVYERVKDADSAIALYQRVLQKQPKLELAINNLASVLADYRTDKESLQQATRLVEAFDQSSNPSLLDTYAWVAVRTGDKEKKAIPALKRVIAAAPEVAVFHYHLGVAYYQASDRASARAELEQALELAKKQGDFVGIEQARSLLKEISGTPVK